MRRITYYAFALLAAASQAKGGEIDANLFGHKVRVVDLQNDPDYWSKGLQVDGKTVLRTGIISIDEIAIQNGVPVLIGYASPGGNACDSAPFVVSFPSGELPRVDGPVDTCSAPPYVVGAKSILFTTPASAARKGERWVWTFNDGFQPAEAEPFVPKGSGWIALRTRTLSHPADLLGYSDTNELIESMAGSKSQELRTILLGPGSGKFSGDTFLGSACQAHNCAATGSLFIAEGSKKRIFVAWKPDGAPIEVRPRVAEWPSEHRQRLKEWAREWTKPGRR